jgi:hypothetical protein
MPSLHRARPPIALLFMLLVLMVFVEHRMAERDWADDAGVVLQNDEAVEGEEIFNKLILANDGVVPHVPHVAPLQRERPALLAATTFSLLCVRGLESRAPPASFSA